MSLFEFISKSLAKEKKTALFQDKAVVLCLFRVAFTPLEQQMLLRLAYISTGNSDNPDDSKGQIGFKVSKMEQSITPPNIVVLEDMLQPNFSAQQASNKDSAKKGKVMSAVVARDFASKLYNLCLIQELKISPHGGMARIQSHSSSMRLTGFGNNASRDQEFRYKSFKLLGSFANDLTTVPCEDFKLSFLKRKSRNSEVNLDLQTKMATRKWERLTHFMLNVDQFQLLQPGRESNDSAAENEPYKAGLSEELVDLLKSAKYVEPVNSSGKFSLTSPGFNYVLLDTPSQVHELLRKFIEYVEVKFPERTVELLQLIFNLSLAKFHQAYMAKVSSEVQQILKEQFEQMGLVEFLAEDPEKFCITKLMQSFLLTQTGSEEVDEIIDSTEKADDKFVIVETNYRVFAYTKNKLFKEIMKLFVEPIIEFPNMLFGNLTKSSMERVFRQQITSKQIMGFLQSHAHSEAQYAKIKEHLSKEIEESIRNVTLQNKMSLGTVEKQESISSLFGLSKSSTYGLQSVAQQLSIWEEQMKGYKETSGILLEFSKKTQEQAKGKFLHFANQKQIPYTIYDQEGQSMVVVGKQYSHQIYQFYNDFQAS